VVAAACLVIVVVVVALWLGGGHPEPPPPGIPDSGGLVEWGLPILRVLADAAAVVTVGLLLAAACLLPSHKDVLSSDAVRAERLASWSAHVWAILSAALSLFILADVLGFPLSRTLQPAVIATYLPALLTAWAWMITAALAALVAVVARLAHQPLSAWFALLLGIAAVLPPAASGHAASSGGHDLAVSALTVHVVAVAVWVGGLLALVWYARTGGRFLSLAAHRFSTLAGAAYVAVGISGVGNAVVRLPSWSDLLTSGYGRLVLVKVAGFIALGCFGWWHRRHTLPRLAKGEPGAFASFARVEAVVMLTLIGVAVALSRTPTPPNPGAQPPTQALEVLGFAIPPHPTLGQMFVAWRLDVLIAVTLLAMAVGYAVGVHRLHKRGDKWPWGRTISWFVGIAILTFATLSGLGTYGRLLFSIHMFQHMTMSMLAPIFLVLGAPISLALRVLPSAGRDQPAGAREWLLAVLHSRVVRFLTHPVVAFVLFISAPYMVYFSGLFQYAMFHHWAHLAMHVHFVLVGYLFYESILGIDPLPRRASYPLRLVLLFLSLPFHAFFAVALMSSNQIVASTYYHVLGNPYHLNLLADQTTGAALAWGFGEFPMVIALLTLLIQWSRDDSRRADRQDRQAERDHDAELQAYNEMLAHRPRR